METLSRDVHLNLVDSSRRLFELDPGARVESAPGWLFAAGRSSHPAIANAAFRIDDGVDAEDFIAAARSFFSPWDRGFAIWARAGVGEDDELIAAAGAQGFQAVLDMPEMVLGEHPAAQAAPDGVEIRAVSSPGDASDYWRVAQDAYASLGFPPDVFSYYDTERPLHGDGLAAFVARLERRAVGIALTAVSDGVAGIYWVGSTEDVRGRGVGWAVTAAAVEAGFAMGGRLASLQASPMGAGLYRRMGFETIFSYRLLVSPPA